MRLFDLLREQHSSLKRLTLLLIQGKKVSLTPLKLILLFFVVSFLSSSCVTLYDPEASQEWNAKVIGVLTPENTIGQRFVSRRARLNHIQLWMRESDPGATPNARLWLHLFHSPSDQEPLFSASIPYTRLTNSFPVSIPIDIQDDPAGQTYYLELETSGSELQIYGRPEDAYPNGKFFVDGIPGESDMAFRLSYDYDLRALLSDFCLVLKKAWLLLPILLVIWLPGHLLLSVLRRKSPDFDFDAGQQIALAIALSLSVIPVVLLWTSWLKISLTGAVVVFIFLLLALFYFWRMWRDRWNTATRQQKDIPGENKLDFVFLILIMIFMLTFGVRLIMVRDLATPAWVDPLHHATITRLILERGAYPSDYQPYLDIDSAGYHPGFHAVLAVFLWLSGLALDEGMLVYGQLLNALMVFSVYLFTTTLTKNRIAGLIAALISGVMTPMPAYYASWGRYTQLAGLIILPAAIALVMKSWDAKPKAAFVFLSALACAGLFLVHYRVIAFLALLLLSLWIGINLQALVHKDILQKNLTTFGMLLVIAILALLFTSPQLPSLLRSEIIQRVSPGKSDAIAFADFSWSYLTTAYGRQALFLAALGLLLSLLQARWFGPVLALWVSLLLLLANPMRMNLPGVGLVNNTSVLITLFLPIATLAGYLIASFLETISRLTKKKLTLAYWSLVIVIGFFLAIKAAQVLLPILNPVTMLSRQADKAAIEWLADNISQEETILISPFLWGYGLYAGQDGGYWITPLSGHRTFPPPVLYGLDEREKILETNRLSKEVIEIGENPEQLYEFMQAQELNYLFIGVKGQVYSFQNLQASPLFTLRYNQDGASIFRRESCSLSR